MPRARGNTAAAASVRLIVTSPIKIDIWSDIACPWCYIGKRHLEGGIAALGADAPDVEIEYHSFELAPDTPLDFEGSEVDFLAGHKGIPVEQVLLLAEALTGQLPPVGEGPRLPQLPVTARPS